jgi:tetratricopeptide (TPR) repeat protein
MKTKKFKLYIDPLTIVRKVHAQLFDRPVKAIKDNEKDELIKGKLQEFILRGQPAGFRKWLKRYDPDWQTDPQAEYCMGASFKAERRYDEAEKCYNAALHMWQDMGNRVKISFALQELSVIALSRSDNQTAWWYLDEAMKVLPNKFSSHFNRLCLASVQRDEKKLRNVFQDMDTLCKEWYKDPNVKLFQTDGELKFLRDQVPELWQKIKKQIKED